jgi:tetratricopeptide (TPR) repeat protein
MLVAMFGRFTRAALVLSVAVATSSPALASPRGELRALREHIDAVPTDALAHNELGVMLVGQGKLDEAQTHLWLAVLLDDALTVGWSNLGLVHRKAKQHERALAAFGKSLSQDPAQPELWYSAGGSLRTIERTPESMFALRAFLEHAPADHTKRTKVARVIAKWTGQGITPTVPQWPPPRAPADLVERAAKVVAHATRQPEPTPPSEALATSPPEPTVTPQPTHRGDKAFETQHYLDALEAYRQQSALEPDDGVLLYKLGATLAILGDPRGALRAWRTVLRQAPARLILNRQIAFATRRLADWGMTQTAPDQPEAVERAAREALLAGDPARVLVLTTDTKSPEALFLRGEAALRIGRLGDALAAFDAGLALAPSDRGLRGGRAEVLIHLENAAAETAAQQWLDDPEATTASFLAARALVVSRRIRHGLVLTGELAEDDDLD